MGSRDGLILILVSREFLRDGSTDGSTDGREIGEIGEIGGLVKIGEGGFVGA